MPPTTRPPAGNASGLIEAGKLSDLLAGNIVVSPAAHRRRDVTLTAVKGDVINERAVTRTGNGTAERRDYLDSAVTHEAANDLTMNEAVIIANTGGAARA